jgi:hypothetical protein
MKRAAIILLLILEGLAVMAQAQDREIQALTLPERESRNRTVYAAPLKLCVGYEQGFRLTRKKWSSARLNLMVSPNVLWSGYNHDQGSDDALPSSKYDKLEVCLPLLLRFEFSPYRILSGSMPGKNDYNATVYLETGLMFNYLLYAHLNEHFSSGGGTFRYTFDGPITGYAQNKISSNYLAFGVGFRYNRISLGIRDFQPITPTKYDDISSGWGLPPGVKSFFYSEFPNDPFLNQGIILLCLGYSF